MNLADLIDPEYGLQQDEWSLNKHTFGEENHLEVVGWSGRNSSSNKYYIVKCMKCSDDAELFQGGYFNSLKGNLVKGQVPCGCSGKHYWTEDQYRTLCLRRAEELGYLFLGFNGDWDGRQTRLRLLCHKHAEWSSGTVSGLLGRGDGCPECKSETISNLKTKSDDVMINSFFASGAFHPDTKFWRSCRQTLYGLKASYSYWYMFCPECGEQGESYRSNLQKGKRPCGCSLHRQQECYINWIIDDHNSAVGIKFGIANNSSTRIQSQNRHSIYEVRQYQVYKFPTVESCRSAERECKQTLVCSILTKEEMPDGYTETTDVLNLVKIKRIYEKYGGVILDV